MDIVFTSFGAPFFARYLAKRTGHRFLKPHQCLVESKKNANMNLFVVGMYYPVNPFYRKIGRFKKVVMIFAGSDILRLKTYSKAKREKMLKDAKDRGVIFATESPITQEYIKRKFKIDTDIIYLPSSYKSSPEAPSFPSKFSVGCYMPSALSKGQSKRYFYGFSTIIEVVKRMPEVDFHFYCRDGYIDLNGETKWPNLIPYNKTVTDMKSFLKNVSCGLRLVEHDTYSMSAIEYIMEGRWFINNYEMPHCEKISHKASPDEIIEVIKEVMNREGMNMEGKKIYDEYHSLTNFKRQIKKYF
jgi:hypothetical protein